MIYQNHSYDEVYRYVKSCRFLLHMSISKVIDSYYNSYNCSIQTGWPLYFIGGNLKWVPPPPPFLVVFLPGPTSTLTSHPKNKNIKPEIPSLIIQGSKVKKACIKWYLDLVLLLLLSLNGTILVCCQAATHRINRLESLGVVLCHQVTLPNVPHQYSMCDTHVIHVWCFRYITHVIHTPVIHV